MAISSLPWTRRPQLYAWAESGGLYGASWNKFCFTRGYIEAAIVFPGPDANTQGYWPGAWTMGNLARPGYTATTDGTWPYTAALHSDASQSKYNFELSWLRGQKLSACSDVTVGRGAPEIDVLEVEKDKETGVGQVVSQSAQFASFADGEQNIGCNPPDFPTTDYINNHLEAYSNPNITLWQWDRPKNQLFHGSC
ncbi:beta-glucan synthesis-associated protein-domain-containing protein [Mycena belliarum]|uniref:Beta-glucan synthesis-associated protein-domain-containing protein n=1 Tax=Mycena belliarum TaxID=1033014 RepID=A0AAD6XL44_9AGAR|nr:beta-glucan synthesis-associated protein-domain-containing protein [Mycena belliae]